MIIPCCVYLGMRLGMLICQDSACKGGSATVHYFKPKGKKWNAASYQERHRREWGQMGTRAWHQQAYPLSQVFSFFLSADLFLYHSFLLLTWNMISDRELCNLSIPCPKHKKRFSYFELEIFNQGRIQNGLDWISWNNPCGEGEQATRPPQVWLHSCLCESGNQIL